VQETVLIYEGGIQRERVTSADVQHKIAFDWCPSLWRDFRLKNWMTIPKLNRYRFTCSGVLEVVLVVQAQHSSLVINFHHKLRNKLTTDYSVEVLAQPWRQMPDR